MIVGSGDPPQPNHEKRLRRACIVVLAIGHALDSSGATGRDELSLPPPGMPYGFAYTSALITSIATNGSSPSTQASCPGGIV